MRKMIEQVLYGLYAQAFELFLVDGSHPGNLGDGSGKIHVRSRGFEPLSRAPQALILSIEIRAPGGGGGTRRVARRPKAG